MTKGLVHQSELVRQEMLARETSYPWAYNVGYIRAKLRKRTRIKRTKILVDDIPNGSGVRARPGIPEFLRRRFDWWPCTRVKASRFSVALGPRWDPGLSSESIP